MRGGVHFRSSLTWLRCSAFGTLLLLGYILTRRPEGTRLQVSFPSNKSTDSDSCIHSTSAEKIVVSVKTGASEAPLRIPTQMQTTLRCAKNVVFFSDLEQDIGEYHLHDALNAVSSSVVENNPDSIFYRKQRELWRTEKDVSALKGAKNPESPDNLAAWTLDKYKNLHIVEKTWALKPHMDWYIFIDADTYVFWSNLLLWLQNLDPTKKSYFGSEVSISGTRFAHGGSGIILSKAAMYELAVTHNNTAAQWDPQIREHCCGDLMLSLALKEYGTELQDVWPLMSGETPSTMPFGPGTPEYQCRPALTMHHLSPTEMGELAKFEEQRLQNSEPMTHVELFENFTRHSIQSQRQNWDNLASDSGEFGKTGGVSLEALSFEECAEACETDARCFQYTQHGHTCYIGMSVRLGYEKEDDEGGIWRSGWHQDRLANWASSQPRCKDITFPVQDTQMQ